MYSIRANCIVETSGMLSNCIFNNFKALCDFYASLTTQQLILLLI